MHSTEADYEIRQPEINACNSDWVDIETWNISKSFSAHNQKSYDSSLSILDF